MGRIATDVIFLKLEVTAGTDAVPTSANTILCSEPKAKPIEAEYINRNIVTNSFGASPDIATKQWMSIEFTIECAGSGTAGVAPPIGPVLQACSFAEALLTTPPRVEYTPVTNGGKTCTIYYYKAGLLHKIVGAMGTFSFSAKAGEIAKMMCKFIGADGGKVVANGSPSYTPFKAPIPIVKANVSLDAAFGGTYLAGAISGAASFTSWGIEFDIANKIEFTANCSREGADIGGREGTGALTLELSAVDELANIQKVKTGTLQSYGFKFGVAAGNTALLFAPNVQLKEPDNTTINGNVNCTYKLKLCPLIGDDEIRIVFL